MSKIKSIEEHCEYVCEMAKISFFFAYHHYTNKNAEKDNIVEVIQKRTPLFFHALRLSDKNDLKKVYPDKDLESLDYRGLMDLGEQRVEWRDLMDKAKTEIEQGTSAEKFENVMFDYIMDFAIERAKLNYPTDVGVSLPEGYNAGSLKYDPPAPEKRPANYCNFHIANAVFPKSIFDDPKYLPECFNILMEKSEIEYGFDTLTTGTWLNDHPTWLALFPDEWIDNLSPRHDGVGWSFGSWGQMVNARGTFNHKAGNYLREHGVLKYKGRSSQCSFANMRKKLAAL